MWNLLGTTQINIFISIVMDLDIKFILIYGSTHFILKHINLWIYALK